MDAVTTLSAATPAELLDFGLSVHHGRTIEGSLIYERPAFVHDPRCIRDCTIGAFTLINGRVTTSLYRCHIGRYGQIGEAVILGPPEHPHGWFSSHPFAFSRPEQMPNMYRLPDFARLAPESSETPSYADTLLPPGTWLGHEAYVGAGSFVKRGVRIGNGAIVGAQSVVVRDVPDYGIVVGAPAKLVRLRFPEKIVERFLQLRWWRYDLAPFKHQVDFSRVEATLEFFEERQAAGELSDLQPDCYRVQASGTGFRLEKQPAPLF